MFNLKFSIKNLLGTICFAAVLIAGVVVYLEYFQSHRSHVSASAANRVLWEGYELPGSASDVSYYVDFGACEADFSISEKHFLEWCSARGWQPTKITTPIEYFQPQLRPVRDRVVKNGFTFMVPDGEGVYDGDLSRSAFWASTFP